MNLLLTGVSGYIGQSVVREIIQSNPFDRVVSIDVRTPSQLGPSHFIKADFSRVDLADIMVTNGIDTVLHLASTATIRGAGAEAKMAQSVLDSATLAGAKRVVLPSRDWVYQRQETLCDEEAPLREAGTLKRGVFRAQAQLAARLGWAPVEAKLLIERVAEQYRTRPSRAELVVLRMCSILGEGNSQPIDSVLSAPFLFGPTSGDPRFQFLYLDDAARALVKACVIPDLDGSYNLASREALPLSVVAGILEKRLFRLPAGLTQAVVTGLYRAGFLGFGYDDLVRLRLAAPMKTGRLDGAVGPSRLSSRQALALWRSHQELLKD